MSPDNRRLFAALATVYRGSMSAPSSIRPAGVGRHDRPLAGIVYMLAGMFMLSMMDALAKFAVGQLPIFQLVAIRSAYVLAVLVPFAWLVHGASAFRTKRPWAHAARGAISIGAVYGFLECLRTLPLATAVAICFVAPLLMTAFSVVLLRERVGVHRWTAVALGLVGVGIIVGPDAAQGVVSTGALWALFSAALYALGMTMVRVLSATESDITMMVTQGAFMLVASAAFVPFVAVPVPDFMWAVAAALAATLIGGQFLSFRAMRLAPVGAVAPLQYTELVWASILGLVFWHEWPPANVWWGAAVVVAAGLYTIWRERVRAAAQAAPQVAKRAQAD
jgi:drug/metabolite transporter (DMT)-like permease